MVEKPPRLAPRLLPLVAAALLVGCGEARPPPARVGPTTGATLTTVAQCAAAQIGQPTWAGSGPADPTRMEAFFSSWCTRCHGSTVPIQNRNGAPLDHNFDTYAGARQWAADIDRMAGASPAGTVVNPFMPPSAPVPALEDRKRLACWVAGGAPQ